MNGTNTDLTRCLRERIMNEYEGSSSLVQGLVHIRSELLTAETGSNLDGDSQTHQIDQYVMNQVN